ncbi:hypothetical protein Taro_025556, partial [Colocasia esculenta]|nr:hypothetical protein [Colocasia esculenta]
MKNSGRSFERSSPHEFFSSLASPPGPTTLDNELGLAVEVPVDSKQGPVDRYNQSESNQLCQGITCRQQEFPCRQMQPVRRSKALEGLRLSTTIDHLSTDAHSQSLQPSGSSQVVYACRQQVQDLSIDKRKTYYGKFCKLPNLVFLWSTTLH